MRKLTIACVAVMVAGLVQAASCTWGSGAIMTAENAGGGWSSTTAMTAGALVTMNVYFIDAATLASLDGKSQKELFDAYKGAAADLTGQNKNPSTGAIINAVTINDTAAAAAAQPAVVTATYTDSALGKDFFMARTFTSTYNSATGKGSATGLLSGVGNWQAVPEPTSGLLLLLGVAGLALKRKRV